jgi:hypothetical protein
MDEKFKKELTRLINFHSFDAMCAVPDYILAEYMIEAAQAFAEAGDALLRFHSIERDHVKTIGI